MKSIIQNPLNIVIAWWSLWGLVSVFSLTGLNVPSGKTYLILSLFILSLFVGGKLNKILKNNTQPVDIESDNLIGKYLDFMFKTSSYLLYFVLLFLTIKSILLVYASYDAPSYKFNAFSSASQVGILFNNRLAENLYFLISSPVLFYLALYGLIDFWKNGTFTKLIIAFAFNGMDAFMRMGRVNLYMIIVLFLIVFIVSEHKIISFIKNQLKQVFLLFLAFSFILFIGAQRGYSPAQQVKLFVVDYHTVGFSLFDHELKDNNSSLNTQTTYGRLSVGGLETIFTILIRQFDRDYYSPALENSIRMASKSIAVGVENPPTPMFYGVKTYNSFYTLLYTFYSDGGLLGVLLGGLILGFFLEFFTLRWKRNHRILDAFYLILLISVAILSIFMSQLEIMRTWMILLLLAFLSYFSKKLNARQIQVQK